MGNKSFITLDFVSMDTECSYDYLFIYDGLTYDSPLLGSYSGSTVPDPLLASSGYVSPGLEKTDGKKLSPRGTWEIVKSRAKFRVKLRKFGVTVKEKTKGRSSESKGEVSLILIQIKWREKFETNCISSLFITSMALSK